MLLTSESKLVKAAVMDLANNNNSQALVEYLYNLFVQDTPQEQLEADKKAGFDELIKSIFNAWIVAKDENGLTLADTVREGLAELKGDELDERINTLTGYLHNAVFQYKKQLMGVGA